MSFADTRDRERVQIYFDAEVLPSKTQQSQKDECDINRIMAKFLKTRELTHLSRREPTYGDFTNAEDLNTSMNRVFAAQADFEALSAKVRARMDNSPLKLLEFLADPENVDEARELGLIDPAPPSTKDLLPKGAAASGGDSPPAPPKPAPVKEGEKAVIGGGE